MKTPDEIKKGLKLCGRGCYSGCPYNSFECVEEMSRDALAYIQQLEAELEQVKRERNATVKDLRMLTVNGNTCAFCKNNGGCAESQKHLDSVASCWEWRGPCAGNGGK